MYYVTRRQHQYNLFLCVHFQQQAFNAASVVHHMKKLQLSHSESSPLPLSMPHILVESSTQNDIEILGRCNGEADALDPNGNLIHAASLLSCRNSDSGGGVCHSEPGNTLTDDETREVTNFQSETAAPFRPSKR